MKTWTLLGMLCIFTAVAMAAGVEGKWIAKVPGRDGQTQEMTFSFKIKGEKLTGSVSNARGSLDIENGKISGDEISFLVTMGEIKIVHTGKVSGDEIKFERKREGGDRSQQFTATKQSKN
jgi:hypothetical protein